MLSRLSPGVFATIFSAVYTYVAIFDITPFLYYPLTNTFTTTALLDAAGKPLRAAGPSMHWYGWIAVGLVAAIVATLIIPRSVTQRFERHLVWAPALIATIAILIFERRWLLM